MILSTILCALACEPIQEPPAATVSDAPVYQRMSWESLPATIPIRLASTQILVDEVYVNGQGPFRFVLDTGGMGGGRVDVSLVERLGLETQGSVQAGDGTGRRGPSMPVHTLDSLQLGPLRFEGVRVLSRDYNLHARSVRGPIDGILGFHLFQELLLTIDYPGLELRLEQGALPQADGREILALNPASQVPMIDIELEGLRYPAHIDTGSMGGVSIAASLAKDLPLAEPPIEVGQARTVSGPFPIEMAPLEGQLRIGAHALPRPELTMAEPLRGVNLGGRVLKAFSLSFDQRNRRVRIRMPEDDANTGRPASTRLGMRPLQLPLRTVQGMPVVEVSIGDLEKVPLILDSGAAGTVLAASLVRELGLERVGTERVGDPADPDAIEADAHLIPELRLGEARFKRVPAVSWESPLLEEGLREARGILSLAVFSECLATMDGPAQTLILHRGALGGGDASTPYRLDRGIPTLDIRLGNLSLMTHLDTGNPGELLLPQSAESALSFRQPPQNLGRARTASGSFELRRAQLETPVEIGAISIAGVWVDLNDRFPWANLGSGILGRYAVTFDQVNRRILMAESNAEASAPPTKGPRYGFMLSVRGDGPLEIQGIVPNSPAEGAGLKVGDRILAINGEAIESLSMEARKAALAASPLLLDIERDGAKRLVTLE